MKIKLKSILLENFKGAKSSAINLDCASINVYGDNATGKTTLLDGFLWCLFNKDSQNSTAFEIKALDTTGEAAHNLNHAASVTLDIDGTTLDLKKVLTEKWTRKRGEKSKQFTGHVTTYFLDEVPVKKKDFDLRIADLIDESAFRLLTDARYFNEQMPWKDRRDLLMTVCGDVSIDDILSANTKLSAVPEILKKQSTDDAKKRLNSQRKAINDELTSIPVRIDEATRSLGVLSMPVKDAKKWLNALGIERADFEKEMSALANGGEAPKLQVKLQGIRAEIQKQKNDFEVDRAAKVKVAQESIDFLNGEIRKKTQEQSNRDIELDRNLAATKKIKVDLAALRGEWHEIDGMAFDGSDVCPTCKQNLPKEQIVSAIENFNISKAGMLKEVNAKGQRLKEALARLGATKNDIDNLVVVVNEGLGLLIQKLAPFDEDIKIINAEIVDVSELTNKISELESQIQQADAGECKKELERISLQLTDNSLKTDRRKAVIAQANANAATQKRIDELTGSEEHLVGELTAIEKQLFLLDEFTRARVDLLESKINSKFQIARFKMFSEQINGGLAETCETVLDGVPYGSMNSAGRVQVGMDIIKTLQAHYGVFAPVWIDNRESIVSLPEIDAQVISLIVSEADKQIRVEKA